MGACFTGDQRRVEGITCATPSDDVIQNLLAKRSNIIIAALYMCRYMISKGGGGGH